LVLLAFFLLFTRFFWLQVVQHEHYQTRAEDNRISLVPIVPNRGVIVDRNGLVLARNYSAYTLEITPGKVADLEAVIDAWPASSTSSQGPQALPKLLEESKNFESLPIRTRLTDEEVARFIAQRYRFPGVEIKARLFRQYPQGELASHALGYIGRINDRDLGAIEAKQGAEDNYRGTEHVRQDRAGAEVRVRAARPDRLRAGRGRCRRPGRAGAVAHRAGVRQQPGADRSTPSCSRWWSGPSASAAARWWRSSRRPAASWRWCRCPATTPTCSSTASSPQDWEGLNTSEDKPMVNRALNGAYPPGSTFKPFMALAALRLGKRTPQQTIRRSGLLQFRRPHLPRRQEGRPRHGRHVQVHRRVLRHLLLRAGQRHGHRRHLRLHAPARPRQPHRHRHRGRVGGRAALAGMEAKRFRKPEQQKWYAGETISIGIGQGYNAYTPIQLAQATATIANNGVMFRRTWSSTSRTSTPAKSAIEPEPLRTFRSSPPTSR
jgi:penicillin-binding protein 2